MTYRHGVYPSEKPTSIIPPVRVSAGLPVVFGTAPVNLTESPAANVNKPVLCYTYAEAVAALGFMDAQNGLFAYSLCEFMKSHFALFNVAPVVFVNVLDPATHKDDVTAESKTMAAGKATLTNTGVLRASIVVKNTGGSTTYDLGDDYTVTYNDDGQTIINRVAGGAIATDTATIAVDYSYIDPTAVVSDDIVGGIDVNGVKTGLELVNDVFPRFRLVPGQIVSPGHSTDPEVAAVMAAKAANINGNFKALSLVDIPTGDADNYTLVPAWKNDNNYVDPLQIACWPMVSLGGDRYHLSTQLAGLICRTDGENEDVPYRSPSNQNLQMDSAVLADGTEVVFGLETANYLNGEGIVTVLNHIGGWRAWGNRTSCYPANTDPKDSFIPVRRMFNWVANTQILTYWQRVDFPLNRRQIQTITDSENIRLNGMVARGFLLGGRVEFLQEENPTTDLMDGIARFHVYLTPPSPNREIDFILEYDPSYLQTLFE